MKPPAAAQAPSPAGKPGWPRRILRGFKSIRFAIILMAIIAVACLVGTLVAQEPYEPNAAIAHYGRALGLLVGLLGLNQLYSAWWFLGLLGLLALSVALCTFSGARFSFRKICTLLAHASILLIVAGAILRGVAGIDGSAIIAKGQTTDVLHVPTTIWVDYSYAGPRGEQRVQKESHVMSVSEPVLLNNTNIVADSIVVKDAGSGKTYDPKADYDILEGGNQTELQYSQSSAIGAEPLGFQVRLDDFVIRYYDEAHDWLEVRLDGTAQARTIPATAGKVVKLRPDGTSVEVLRYFADFKLDGSRAYSASDKPLNPAVEVRFTGPAGESKHWLFSNYPELTGHTAMPEGIKIKYVWRPPAVKAFESHVTVLDPGGKEVQKAVVLVNSPLKVGRYAFYQTGYDPETLASSTLEVTSDPGVPLVFAGFILLPVGIALAIYVKPLLNRKARSDV